jgi:Zn-dependent peptidase ImmA (M78 family)
MHRYHVQLFTDEMKSSPWIKEEQAEWQANKFADYFLVSDFSLDTLITPAEISIYCSVEREVALRRLGKLQITGNNCGNCGDYSVFRRGLIEKCDNCGAITQL